eukprot:4660949-Alexandrium_andersonii.AAC.1
MLHASSSAVLPACTSDHVLRPKTLKTRKLERECCRKSLSMTCQTSPSRATPQQTRLSFPLRTAGASVTTARSSTPTR